MKPFPIRRSFFLVVSMMVPVLLAQDDVTKPGADAADAKAKVKAKGKANAKALGPQAKAFARIVAELDANGDETLQKSEVPDSARQQFDELLELVDTDGDGALGRGELQAAGSRIQAVLGAAGPANLPKAKARNADAPAKGFLAEPLERLRQMDTNDDGKVSREEWRGAPPLFDRIDRDADGFITENERTFAVEAMRRFMEAAKKKGQLPRKKPEN